MSEIEISTGNVYADIEVEGANEMLVKAQLAAIIQDILRTRNLAQKQAAEILNVPQPKLAQILRGSFRSISEAEMLECIRRLGRDVRIVIGPERPTPQIGRLMVVHA